MKKEKIKELIKIKLWRFGYGVRDCSDIEAPGFDFDLLVENKFRVIIPTVGQETSYKNYDVMVVEADGKLYFVDKGTKDKISRSSKSPYEIFGRPKVGVNSEKNKKSK